MNEGLGIVGFPFLSVFPPISSHRITMGLASKLGTLLALPHVTRNIHSLPAAANAGQGAPPNMAGVGAGAQQYAQPPTQGYAPPPSAPPNHPSGYPSQQPPSQRGTYPGSMPTPQPSAGTPGGPPGYAPPSGAPPGALGQPAGTSSYGAPPGPPPGQSQYGQQGQQYGQPQGQYGQPQQPYGQPQQQYGQPQSYGQPQQSYGQPPQGQQGGAPAAGNTRDARYLLTVLQQCVQDVSRFLLFSPSTECRIGRGMHEWAVQSGAQAARCGNEECEIPSLPMGGRRYSGS